MPGRKPGRPKTSQKAVASRSDKKSAEASTSAIASATKGKDQSQMKMSKVTSLLDSNLSGDKGTEGEGQIADVIGQKASAKQLSEMNTPLVPGSLLKERPKITKGVCMKNLASPIKSEPRSNDILFISSIHVILFGMQRHIPFLLVYCIVIFAR